jgi:hypothetical protein
VKKIILVVFINISNFSFCQTNYFLEGKLGKSTIYLTIQDFDSELQATYFYQNSLKDIVLEGKKSKNTFTLEFGEKTDDKITEQFVLTKSKNNFSGTWKNSKGKKANVTLVPINFLDYKKENSSVKVENEMDWVKLQFIKFKQDSISKYNGKEFIWYSEKHCNSPFFRLGSSFSEKNKTTINQILNNIHIYQTLSQLNCASLFYYNDGNGIENNIKITFLNKNLLGFEVFSSWFCGGAHPDFGGNGYLLDLNNGKQYEIDDIIAFDKSVTTEEKSGFEAYSNYRTNYFAPKLFDLINESEHFVKPKNDNEDECDYTNVDNWDFCSWNFTEKGIEFTPYFARVARSCEEPFLVPFEKLKKYKNSKFPYDLN